MHSDDICRQGCGAGGSSQHGRGCAARHAVPAGAAALHPVPACCGQPPAQSQPPQVFLSRPLCSCCESARCAKVSCPQPRMTQLVVITWCWLLCSVMAVKLQELNGELLSGGAALWRSRAEQHLLQATALARFLSYLAFAFAEGKTRQSRYGTQTRRWQHEKSDDSGTRRNLRHLLQGMWAWQRGAHPAWSTLQTSVPPLQQPAAPRRCWPPCPGWPPT